MAVHSFDPLHDCRWAELVDAHPSGSVFHTTAWVRALEQTYGFRPVVYTTSPPNAPLTGGILLCRVQSWLTGRRLVSVPFADHCEPLVTERDDRAAILAALVAAARDCRYLELRPATSGPWEALGLKPATPYSRHVLNLQRPIQDLYRAFHPSTVQRRINRAHRAGVTCEAGRSEELLQAFYRLLLMTRRRHGVPPQPIQWFRNLIGCFGNQLAIHVAIQNGREIGALLTLRHGRTVVYKYGCSDAGSHNLGTMPFLFWAVVQDAKATGIDTFDLGRSDIANEGLTTFKERLGAINVPLLYLRTSTRFRQPRWSNRAQSRIVGLLPDRLLVGAGQLLYKHIA